MSKLYLLHGQLSELPCYWEAHVDGQIVAQVDDTGKVIRKRSDLPLDQVTYFGLVCSQGRYGFFINSCAIKLDDQILRIEARDCESGAKNCKRLDGDLYFRRRCVGALGSEEETQLVEIGIGSQRLIVRFVPYFEVVYSPICEKSTSQQGGDESQDENYQ